MYSLRRPRRPICGGGYPNAVPILLEDEDPVSKKSAPDDSNPFPNVNIEDSTQTV